MLHHAKEVLAARTGRMRGHARPHLLPGIELETGTHPNAAVIWLHGLGADGNDFVPIVKEMRLPKALAVRFVFPHAPVRPVTINNGFPMRAWYDIYAADLANRADTLGVLQSQAAVEALIAREKMRGVAAKRIVVAGFSQGGAIALYTALRHAERLAGHRRAVDIPAAARPPRRGSRARQSRRADLHGARHDGSGGAARVGRGDAPRARSGGLRGRMANVPDAALGRLGGGRGDPRLPYPRTRDNVTRASARTFSGPRPAAARDRPPRDRASSSAVRRRDRLRCRRLTCARGDRDYRRCSRRRDRHPRNRRAGRGRHGPKAPCKRSAMTRSQNPRVFATRSKASR